MKCTIKAEMHGKNLGAVTKLKSCVRFENPWFYGEDYRFQAKLSNLIYKNIRKYTVIADC